MIFGEGKTQWIQKQWKQSGVFPDSGGGGKT